MSHPSLPLVPPRPLSICRAQPTGTKQCMACSNNVVRCALTPKFRDVDLLVDMLTYNMAGPAVLRPQNVDDNRKRFTPPVDVFEIELINVRNG